MGDASQGKELPTIWEVPEALWSYVVAILIEAYPPKRVGRPRGPFRSMLNGIIYRFRTGAQWNHLPQEFGDDSTIHRWFQRWCKDGVFRKIWVVLVEKC